MKVENQVCTLEQALEFKNFGVNQNTFFFYDKDVNVKYALFNKYSNHPVLHSPIAAYTVAELALMLDIKVNNCRCIAKEWYINLVNLIGRNYKTQAECYADYLLFCLNNGRLKVEQINTRLNND